MKTIISILAGSLVFISWSVAKERGNSWAELHLNGKVISVKEKKYAATGINGDKPANNNMLVFDRKGNVIEKYVYKADGSLDVKYTYKYNDDGLLLEQQGHNANGLWVELLKYKYDGRKKTEQRVYGKKGKLESRSTYKYDVNGYAIEEHKYKADGSLYFKSVLKNDENGKIIEEKRYKPNLTLDWTYTWAYDANGNTTETNWYKADGSLMGKDTYSYDDKANLAERILYSADGKPKTKYSYKYDYDTKLNWTKRTELENDVLHSVWIKEIEYF